MRKPGKQMFAGFFSLEQKWWPKQILPDETEIKSTGFRYAHNF